MDYTVPCGPVKYQIFRDIIHCKIFLNNFCSPSLSFHMTEDKCISNNFQYATSQIEPTLQQEIKKNYIRPILNPNISKSQQTVTNCHFLNSNYKITHDPFEITKIPWKIQPYLSSSKHKNKRGKKKFPTYMNNPGITHISEKCEILKTEKWSEPRMSKHTWYELTKGNVKVGLIRWSVDFCCSPRRFRINRFHVTSIWTCSICSIAAL